MEKTNQSNKLKFIVAAGGTGGHLFPAIAVVDNIKKITNIECEFIFVGNPKKIEGRIVPKLGYKLIELDIFGFKGLFRLENVILPFKINKSIRKIRKIIKSENVKAVIATGAYLSYPPGMAAYYERKPLFILESNLAPGKANRKLAPKAKHIFTSFEDTKQYFNPNDKSKIIDTGNPIRMDFNAIRSKDEARKSFGLEINKTTVLVLGGSLGAMSINKAIESNLDKLSQLNIQLIWQTGKNYKPKSLPANIKSFEFIDSITDAYSSADLVIARAGATTVAEIIAMGLPSILVPLPIASNNEQKLNALFLQSKGACIILEDSLINYKISQYLNELIFDNERLTKMSISAKSLDKPDAGKRIAEIILKSINL